MSTETERRMLEPAYAASLGAHHDGRGASFALFSSVAEAVDLCLFDDAGKEARWSLEQGDGYVWQGYLPDVVPGARYGYRVHGPWAPGGRRPLQLREAAPRSVRTRDRGRGALEPGRVRPRARRSGPCGRQ